MKTFIKNKLKNYLTEQIIDGQEMDYHMQTFCNTMSVKNYDEVIGRLLSAIGPKEENPELWARIEKPLNMLKKANYDLDDEQKKLGMTGDSQVDEANTWWSAIQTVICEQGPEFQ